MEKRNAKALLPIAVFVVLYLGLGILFEYGLEIEMGFYKIPVVVIFLMALFVACLQNRSLKLNDKLKVMGEGISDPNIITMIIIFMLAGIFVGVVGRSSANRFYIVADPTSVCSDCSFCCELLCLSGHGNIRWNDHTDRSHWNSGIQSFWIFHTTLYCYSNGRCNVWR